MARRNGHDGSEPPREDPESQPNKGPKQKELLETSKIPAVRKAARAYVEARGVFQEASKTVTDCKQQLQDAMHRHGLTAYVDGEFTIEISTTESIKVRLKDDEEAAA